MCSNCFIFTPCVILYLWHIKIIVHICLLHIPSSDVDGSLHIQFFTITNFPPSPLRTTIFNQSDTSLAIWGPQGEAKLVFIKGYPPYYLSCDITLPQLWLVEKSGSSKWYSQSKIKAKIPDWKKVKHVHINVMIISHVLKAHFLLPVQSLLQCNSVKFSVQISQTPIHRYYRTMGCPPTGLNIKNPWLSLYNPPLANENVIADVIDGYHFYLPFYHLSMSQKCYGI